MIELKFVSKTENFNVQPLKNNKLSKPPKYKQKRNKQYRYKPKKSKTDKLLRPVFFYDDHKTKQIKAGGIIFYRFNKITNKTEFLLIKCNNKYEDFGGKTDPQDTCIEETVAREAEEESNKIFSKCDILKNINKIDAVYSKCSKYLIYFIRTDTDYRPEDFGTIEIFEQIPRTVEWVPYSRMKRNKFSKKNLHIRLLFNDFFKKIYDINTSLKKNSCDILSELDKDLYELEKLEIFQKMQKITARLAI